ncbi:MAG TPA: malate dehydrogenase [Chloroflexota bacterium]|jgi:malate dehydrogenase|nr:malate dehydrogenase [Chloroflexota bacterium]
MRMKISIIGAGAVGASAARAIAERNYADILLVDVVDNLPQGVALDIIECGPIIGFDAKVTGSNRYEDIEDSDLVLVTAGLPRKPGMSRDDLVRVNADIVRSVMEHVRQRCPHSIVLIMTNPLDAMAHLALKETGFDSRHVIGQAGVLDSARFRTFIAAELKVSVNDVSALVLGGHGDQMVPLPRFTTVNGVPLPELLGADSIDRLVQRTRDGGAEIVNLLGRSAYYAPAAAFLDMVDAIVFDQRRLLSASVYLDGQYGQTGIYLGVPIILGAQGVERIVELDLDSAEQAALAKSAGSVRELLAILGL